MNRSSEQLHNGEHLGVAHPESALKKEVALSPELANICASRGETFVQIERWLKVKTRERLREKLERERKILMELYQRDRKAKAVAQQTTHVLNRAYFRQKSLDISIFE